MTVKFKIILIFIFTLSVNTAFSQEEFKVKNYIGFRGGASLSAVNMDINRPFYLNNGITYGVSFKNLSKKHAGLILELNYSEKGGYNKFYRSNLPDPAVTDSLEIPFIHSLSYIELPFLMNLRVGGKHSVININAGSTIGYLYTQEIEFTETILSEGQYKSEADGNFEYGLAFGLSYGYAFGIHLLELEVRYSHGLTNIFKSRTINNSLVSQNQVLSLTLAYYINLKKYKTNVENIKS